MSLIENERPVKVEVRSCADGYSLFRDGKPFFVKGAGGFEYLDRLAALGGNSVRTWGWEQTERALPAIREHGLTLCAGLWLTPPRMGVDYRDERFRREQFETIKEQVLGIKEEPGLLLWGVGNELELSHASDEAVWKAVEEVARFIKEVDPNHPVMTVLSCVHAKSLRDIEALCPSLDFVSFNSYGDLESVQSKLDECAWSRPYLITEWGGDGHWEVPKTRWGAEIEPTSAQKAEQMRQRYRCFRSAAGRCLGSYAFLWGHKQERTPTWYGLLTEDGRLTESAEALEALWAEDEEAERTPRLGAICVNGYGAEDSLSVKGGEKLEGRVDVLRGNPKLSSLRWWVAKENPLKRVGGDEEAAGMSVGLPLETSDVGRVSLRAPLEPGAYRLFIQVNGPEMTVATANFPFEVQGNID